ncbi:CMGC/SRPK protein kinase [Blastomyces percursus]|uniref:CMGC/SRPK protein kinase n=1 Tax=Blastomyces percursus TaxID=1658174 RepID=A0A1J9Q0D4_9EURO|nr:CMGC/SRPK protein kinase [Blastomyces percursus]
MSSLPSPAREFSKSGFPELSAKKLIEEEDIPSYKAEQFYPVHIGEVFKSRYQVVSKLGFGTSSTVWLCRDLREHRYLTLKVCIRKDGKEPREQHEITVSQHLNGFPVDKHAGKDLVRKIVDSFEVTGPNGVHQCLLYMPLGMSYTNFLKLFPDKMFPKDLVQKSIQFLLVAVAYLHQCEVVHTDISSNNLLQGVHDDSILSRLEQDEIDRPSARKSLSDRTIYTSRPMPTCTGLPVLCDLGDARIGNHMHQGDIMPGIYRAPEVILGMEWNYKVDLWSVGVMTWDIFEGERLFFAKKDGILNDEQHLAEMVSLLGPPPQEFIKGNEKCRQYWDDQGSNWKGSVPIPDQSFETREWRLNDEDRTLFLNFLRRALRWMPEERPTAEELAYDNFLMQPLVESSAISSEES